MKKCQQFMSANFREINKKIINVRFTICNNIATKKYKIKWRNIGDSQYKTIWSTELPPF